MTTSSGLSQALSSTSPTRNRELTRVLRLARRPTSIVGIAVLAIVVLVAALAPVLSPAEPGMQHLGARLRPPLALAGGRLYILGSDQLGRDVFARLLYGSRISLTVGVISVALSGTVGVALGLLSGYFGGAADVVLMRLVDVLMAFPFVLLALVIMAVLGASALNVILVFSVTSWVAYARTVRAVVLSVRGREFVEATRALGADHWRVLLKHILPNTLSPVIIIASFELARIITTEAALTFLGVGIPPTTASWGSMISDGRGYLDTAWWIAMFPGLALLLVVVSVNFVGDLLRDVLDPRSRAYAA